MRHQISLITHPKTQSFVFLLLFHFLFACTPKSGVEGGPSQVVPKEDPFNVINSATVENGKIIDFKTSKIGKDAFYREDVKSKESNDKAPGNIPVDKIHPLLRKKIAANGSSMETVVIVFQDTYKIPRFPEPNVKEPRSSAYNQRAMKEAQNMVAKIQKERASDYSRIEKDVTDRYKVKILERFWLINGVVAEMPLKFVNALADRKDVMYIEPQNTEDVPPQNANNNDDVEDGRARMVSDPYFNLGLPLGWIGLLDTGVRRRHTQFNSPSHIDFMRDCVNGGSDCNTGSTLNPDDDCWNHGTSSAAIITANANQGNQFRGVTAITLDNFKVYPSTANADGSCGAGLNATAAVRGFQTAVAVLDRVIVAEMQGTGGSGSSISLAADNAFDAGAVIIAANGNNGPNASTVNVPANAHKVIGVGNFDVQTTNQVNSQSRGPASDNRYKPDIQAPTNTETASNASDVAFQVFTGTSGATPYAAGSAALLRNWLRGNSFSIDPGQVYAQMILCGQQPYPFNNTSGAGPLRMPTNGWAWWGKVTVSNGQVIDIPLSVDGSTNTFDAALWWPETEGGSHNDVDLSLVAPDGTVISSLSIPSVFERVRKSGTIARGNWRLRIRGFSVTGNQTVYWSAAHWRP